jgi:hypothetical protein
MKKSSLIALGVAVVADLIITLLAGAVASAQVWPSEWHAAVVVTVQKGTAALSGVAAVGPGDVWAVGQQERHGSPSTGLIEHRSGRFWVQVKLPETIRKDWSTNGMNAPVIGASSSANVWLFSQSPTGPARAADRQAVHFVRHDGNQWTFGTLPGTEVRPDRLHFMFVTVSTVDALSRNDVWVLGGSTTRSGHSRPYAAQFNGRYWRSVPVPGTGVIVAATALSRDDILAVVGTDAYLGFGTTSPLLLRWDGSHWQRTSTQLRQLPAGASVTTMVALPRRGVWVGGDYPKDFGTEYFVAHLSGTAWKLTDIGYSATSLYALTSLVPDQYGGLWALGATFSPQSSQELWHFNGKTWSTTKTRFGGTGSLVQLASAPGTGTVWGVGTIRRGRASDGLIGVAAAISG